MPALKKDPSVRARRNKAASRATLAGGASSSKFGSLSTDRDWHPETVVWWSEITTSPMAVEWHPTDRHELNILARLVDAMNRTDDILLYLKIAEQEGKRSIPFGLTPYARKRLEWTSESADEAKARGNARRRTPAPASASKRPDPRAGLHSVS